MGAEPQEEKDPGPPSTDLDLLGDGAAMLKVLSPGDESKQPPMPGDVVDLSYVVCGAQNAPGAGKESDRGTLKGYVVCSGSGPCKGLDVALQAMHPGSKAVVRLRRRLAPFGALYAVELTVTLESLATRQVLGGGEYVRVRASPGLAARQPLPKRVVAKEGSKVTVKAEMMGDMMEMTEVPPATFVIGDGTACEAVEKAVMHASAGESLRVAAKPSFLLCDATALPPAPLAEAAKGTAGVNFVVTLESVEAAPAVLATAPRLEGAKRYKDHGAGLFKAGALRRACEVYQLGMALVDTTKVAAQFVDADRATKAAEEMYKAEGWRDLYFPCALNAALCANRTGEHRLAVELCTKVLSLDPKCVKALFRRGQARVALDLLPGAEEDLRRAHELDPLIRRDFDAEMRKLKAKEQAAKPSEAGKFKKIFEGKGLYDEKDCAPEGQGYPSSKAVMENKYKERFDASVWKEIQKEEEQEEQREDLLLKAKKGDAVKRATKITNPWDRDGSRAEKEENDYYIKEFEKQKEKDDVEDWERFNKERAERKAAEQAPKVNALKEGLMEVD